MRYFRIMYASHKKIYNSLIVTCDTHPGEESVQRYVNEIHPGTGDIMITSIHEFQSEEDFKEFTRGQTLITPMFINK